MVSPNVDRMLQEAKSLTLDERQQIIELLNARAVPAQPEQEQVAEMRLKNGFVITIPPKRTAEEIARFKEWKPIEMPCGPLSDDIIRDRR